MHDPAKPIRPMSEKAEIYLEGNDEVCAQMRVLGMKPRKGTARHCPCCHYGIRMTAEAERETSGTRSTFSCFGWKRIEYSTNDPWRPPSQESHSQNICHFSIQPVKARLKAPTFASTHPLDVHYQCTRFQVTPHQTYLPLACRCRKTSRGENVSIRPHPSWHEFLTASVTFMITK